MLHNVSGKIIVFLREFYAEKEKHGYTIKNLPT